MMHGNWFGNGYCPLWGGFNTFNMWTILLIVGVIVAIVGIVIVQKSKRSSDGSAMEMLKLEYVKGNITEEEYINRKSVIERK